MTTDIIWLYCEYCGEKTPHRKQRDGSHVCIVSHEKTKIALDRINKGETLKNPKGGKK